MVLVGQVADSGQPAKSVEGMAVSLLRGSDTLSQTSTNQFGEFRFSFRDSEQVQVLVDLKETAVLLSLPGADSGAVLS